MNKTNESELVEFFEVLPTPQPREEREFFGTTEFCVERDGLKLTVSFGEYDQSVLVTLATIEAAQIILDLRIGGVSDVRVRRDKPAAIPVLIIEVIDNQNRDADIGLEIHIRPTLRINVQNRPRGTV